MRAIVIKVDNVITFDNGFILYSEHEQDCCESHELTLDDLSLKDFEGLEFDLDNPNFFTKLPDYGIQLNPIKGLCVRIPAHGYNNGYYGTNIDLIISNKENNIYKTFDITECQEITD
jgi:hypothetical protein